MGRYAKVRLLTVGVCLGWAATIVLLSTLAIGATNGPVAWIVQGTALNEEVDPAVLPDLVVRAMAPVLVDVDSTYVVNVSYANGGWVQAVDNWVRVTLPEGTQFVGATFAGGEPRPPDEIDGRVLNWNVPLLVANSTWGHILVEARTDEGLAEGTVLDVLAEVGGSGGDADPKNNSITVASTVQELGGAMKRVHVREAMPADVLEYTITVDLPEGEPGGKQLVTMTDTLPARQQVRFLGWVDSPSGVLTEGHRLYWQGEVQPGQPVQLRYRLGVEGDVPPGAIISNVAALRWQNREMQLGPVPTVFTVPHGVMGVGPGQGGQVGHRYGMTLTVPAGGVDDSTRFEIAPLDTEVEPIAPPGGLWYANRAFEMKAYRFGDPVGQFGAPMTITCAYSDRDVVGLKRETLRLWRREGPEGPWAMMDAPVRSAVGTIVHTTTHLSEFALFGEPVAPGQVDLTVRATAPVQVVAGASYVVNVSYANQGWIQAHDNWVRVTVPADAQFVGATYPGGEAHPPDAIDGRVLTWNIPLLVANSAWGHILVEIKPDEGLADGTVLEVMAEIGGSEDDSDVENNMDTATTMIIETVADPPYRCYLPLVRVQ